MLLPGTSEPYLQMEQVTLGWQMPLQASYQHLVIIEKEYNCFG